ncbi:MAG: hypothetical protein LAO07_13200 [Acidobacteriia bacterium]|nr:hypothetical protein [Terriglobia bacterium]
MKRSLARKVLLAATAVILLSATAWADTLELKDGRLLQGKYLGGTQDTLRFQVQGNIEVYRVADVLALTFGEASVGTSTPASQPAPQAAPSAQPSALAAAPASATPSAPATDSVTVPAGTYLRVRMIDGVDSQRNRVGDRFAASLDEDLVVGGTVAARKGTDVYGRLADTKQAGQMTGRSELKLELTDILINGVAHPIITGDYQTAGSSRTSDSAKKVGGGAALGAIIGAIAGGGKGAAIGAGVGAGAGTAVQVLTHGEQVRVPSETLLEFRLEQPLTLQLPSSTG